MFLTPLFLLALPHTVELSQLAPRLAVPTQVAAQMLQVEGVPSICESPRARRRGTGLLATGLAFATLGYILRAIGKSIEIEDTKPSASGGEDLGFATAAAFGANLLAATSLATSFTLIGVGANRRGRWNGHGVRCSKETRMRPRLGLGLSLVGAGAVFSLANALYAYNVRPRCENCHAAIHHTGSFIGLSLMLSGVAWTTYSAGFRR